MDTFAIWEFKSCSTSTLHKIADTWMEKVCEWSHDNQPVTVLVPDSTLIDYHNYGVAVHEHLKNGECAAWCSVCSELEAALDLTGLVISWMREEEEEEERKEKEKKTDAGDEKKT